MELEKNCKCSICGTINDFVSLCWIKGCKEEPTCGFPTKEHGYLCVCSKHRKQFDKNE